MISLFSADGWRTPIPPHVAREHVRVTMEWVTFEATAAAAACWVVVQRWLSSGDIVDRLIALRRDLPRHPLVLVTSKDAENARGFRALLVDEVVWLHEIDQALWPAVLRARSRGFRQTFADQVEHSARLPATLREALSVALTAEKPFRSIEALAHAAGCCRGTIWYQWRHVTRDAEDAPRPEDFLDWVLLLHALARHTHHRGWVAIADELGVHEHTLARIARRLLGASLRDLAGTTELSLVERFGGEVLATLGVETGRPAP